MNRRQFLRRTVAGALLLSGAVVIGRHVGGYRLDPALATGLRVLSAKEALIFLAAARRLVAGDGPDAPALDEARALAFVDGYLGKLGEPMRDDVKALLMLVEHGSGVFRGSTARFTRMSVEDQDASLRDWESSRLAVRRQGFQALKTMALLAYWRDDRTWPLLGYGGPLVKRL